MTEPSLMPLILDGAVIALLIAVIFYAGRLSLHLRDFRTSRRDMDGLIRDLSVSVERAEQAMVGLRETARESGRDLQGMINEAAALSEELQLMGETGNSLARRLEVAAEKNGRAATSAPPSAPAPAVRRDGSFAIRDPEFGIDAGDDDGFNSMAFDDEPSGLQSRAERELFDALQGAQRKKARV